MKTSRQYMHPRIGSMRQIASLRRAVLDDDKGRGMRIVEIDNGSGLSFTVYPDRGMDLGEARFRGIPLVWLTANGPVAPQFYEQRGFDWLGTWGGGLLTGCGLMNVGGPAECGGEAHGLHGRLSHTPAGEVNTRTGWNGDRYELEVTGKIRDGRVFSRNLLLTRRISTALGDNSITVEDKVENQGFGTVPLMLLYHMNFGWPLVDEGAYLEAVPHEVQPQNDVAAAGLGEWERILPPAPDFREQVFYHDIPGDAEGIASIRLVNPGLKLALRVSYRTAELPWLVQWRMFGQGEYVCGLEPANCHPEGQPAMERKGLLRKLAPRESFTTRINIGLEEL